MTTDLKTKTGIKPGIYRHFKGNEYLVLDVAIHSETDELMVIYQPQYGTRELWVRPLSMFQDNVEVDGKPVPRFEWVRSL
jgi:hypothetical protein